MTLKELYKKFGASDFIGEQEFIHPVVKICSNRPFIVKCIASHRNLSTFHYNADESMPIDGYCGTWIVYPRRFRGQSLTVLSQKLKISNAPVALIGFWKK